MFEIIYCDVIFLYVKWLYYDCLLHYFVPCGQITAFYVLYVICSTMTTVIPECHGTLLFTFYL